MNPFASPDTNTLRRINLRLRTALPVRIHQTADDAPPVPPVAVKRVVRTGYYPVGRAKLILESLREHGPMTSAEIADRTGIASKFHRKALCWVIKHGLVAEVARGPIVWRAK
jgi:predicted HTH transcriptional regulator